MTAHPRVGGENPCAGRQGGGVPGSSPRGRGKRLSDGRQARIVGLIPAWAGKTLCGGPGAMGVWAHPRVGGENLSDLFIDAAAQGSSPRGRGKLDNRCALGAEAGLIPAWAGKTLHTPD